MRSSTLQEDVGPRECYRAAMMVDVSKKLLSHWLYVSEITTSVSQRENEIASIVEISQRMNPEHGITGCLIASTRHFSQWIEGPPDSLSVLKENVLRDPRHRAIVTISEGALTGRQFASWSMGYFGPSHYVNRVVARTLQTQPQDRERAFAQLCDLIRGLSQQTT